MKKKQVIHVLISLVIFAVAAYSIWHLLFFFARKIAEINPSVSAAIIGSMATVFVGITAVIITQRQTKARELEEAHRTRKVEIYNNFLTIVTKVHKSMNDQVAVEQVSQKELANSLMDYKREILLWGAPKVIKAQLQYEAATATGGNMFIAMDNLYRAIREDIGLNNKGLSEFDLIKLFLKDAHLMDEFLRAGGAITADIENEGKN
jgi:hypothetical protein